MFLRQLDAAVRRGRLSFFSGALEPPGRPGRLRGGTSAPARDRLGRLRQAAVRRPEQVLGYLGRYTHRVAIANSRLVAIDNGKVSFRWKDYRQDGKTTVMTL